jgi:Exoribonuclease Xrn1 D2/D3 domain
LQFFPLEKDENAKFQEIVSNRIDLRYFPSFEVAKIVGLSPKALSKITSRFMANANGIKINLGLNLKFEAKSQKVINYSRKNERYWEFSEKTIELIREYKVCSPFCYRIPEGSAATLSLGKVSGDYAPTGKKREWFVALLLFRSGLVSHLDHRFRQDFRRVSRARLRDKAEECEGLASRQRGTRF